MAIGRYEIGSSGRGLNRTVPAGREVKTPLQIRLEEDEARRAEDPWFLNSEENRTATQPRDAPTFGPQPGDAPPPGEHFDIGFDPGQPTWADVGQGHGPSSDLTENPITQQSPHEHPGMMGTGQGGQMMPDWMMQPPSWMQMGGGYPQYGGNPFGGGGEWEFLQMLMSLFGGGQQQGMQNLPGSRRVQGGGTDFTGRYFNA